MIAEFDQDSIRLLLTTYTLWIDASGHMERYIKDSYGVDDPTQLADAMAQAFIAIVGTRIALAHAAGTGAGGVQSVPDNDGPQ